MRDVHRLLAHCRKWMRSSLTFFFLKEAVSQWVEYPREDLMNEWGGWSQVSVSELLLLTQPLLSSEQRSISHWEFKSLFLDSNGKLWSLQVFMKPEMSVQFYGADMERSSSTLRLAVHSQDIISYMISLLLAPGGIWERKNWMEIEVLK